MARERPPLPEDGIYRTILWVIVLTIAGKLFGIWGLILGLPMTNYIFRHAIRVRGDELPPGAEPALAISDPMEDKAEPKKETVPPNG